MDPIRNRAAVGARHSRRSGAPPSPLPRRWRRRSRWVPAEFPIEFRPPRTCPRTGIRVSRRGSRSPGTERNSGGTELGLIRNRVPSGSSRMGSDWGLSGDSDPSRSSRQPKTLRRSTAWPGAGLRGRRLPRHGDRPWHRAEIRDKAGATVDDAGRSSDRDGPEPGHLRGGALGEDGGRGSARTATTGTKAPRKDRGGPRGSPVPDGRRRARPET
jgi:hypothetical protein